MKQIVVFLPLVLIALIVILIGRREGPEDLIPPVSEAPADQRSALPGHQSWRPRYSELGEGWEEAFDMERFGRDELYAKINGGAEVYLAHGFVDLQVYSFLHSESGDFIELFLFDQGDQARAMYELEKPPSVEEDPELGGYFSGSSLFATKNQYYVQIQAAAETERTTRAVMTLGRLIQEEL